MWLFSIDYILQPPIIRIKGETKNDMTVHFELHKG